MFSTFKTVFSIGSVLLRMKSFSQNNLFFNFILLLALILNDILSQTDVTNCFSISCVPLRVKERKFKLY